MTAETAFAMVLRNDDGTTEELPPCKSPVCAVQTIGVFEGRQVHGMIRYELESISGMQFVLRELGPKAAPVMLPSPVVAYAGAIGQPLTVSPQVSGGGEWRAAWVEERAAHYRRDGMRIEQARIHAEADANRAALSPTQARPDGRLPERDPSKPNTEQGLYRKFDVRRTDGSDQPGGKHDGCEYFVLDVTHDPHARPALAAYRDSVAATHPDLARDMGEQYGLEPAPTADGGAVAWHIQHPDGFVSLRKADAVDSDMRELAAADGVHIRPLVFGDAHPAPKDDATKADEKVLWGIVANAGRLSDRRTMRWAHVMDATGQGSTRSQALCARFGFDPDELVGGDDEEGS